MTHIGKLGQQRVCHNPYETIDNGSSGDERMALEVTRGIRVVYVGGIRGEIHEEVHDQKAMVEQPVLALSTNHAYWQQTISYHPIAKARSLGDQSFLMASATDFGGSTCRSDWAPSWILAGAGAVPVALVAVVDIAR